MEKGENWKQIKYLKIHWNTSQNSTIEIGIEKDESLRYLFLQELAVCSDPLNVCMGEKKGHRWF